MGCNKFNWLQAKSCMYIQMPAGYQLNCVVVSEQVHGLIGFIDHKPAV